MFREFCTISSLHSDLHSYTFPTFTYILIHFLQALTYSYLSYKRLHTMLTNIVRITYEHLTNLPKSAHPRIWDTTKMLSRDLDYKVLFCSPNLYLYHLCSISYDSKVFFFKEPGGWIVWSSDFYRTLLRLLRVFSGPNSAPPCWSRCCCWLWRASPVRWN